MDHMARMTSKGQLTVPKPVREALGLHQGDGVLFRVEEGEARVSRVPDLVDLAGSVPVPKGKENASWDEIRREAREAMIRRHR
jgi:antitoxin PrlF